MRVCFPVQKSEGVESEVFGHFGSCPMFLIVDTEGMNLETVSNGDLHHVHGACNPIMALGGKKVDALVVGGIGGGALVRLNAMGVKVYEAGAPKVKENLELFKDNKLEELSLDHSCKAHEGGCGH